MSQVTDRTVGANPTGFDMRTELNSIIGALESDNSGSSEPLNPVAYMKWLDTSDATYYYYKERNHDNTDWVTLFRYTVATKIMEVVSNGVVLQDSALVHKTENETIEGVKTFTSFPITPNSAPTTDYQFVNKKYVDDNVVTPDATETVKGKVELATDAEVQDGTDTAKAVTPAGLVGAGFSKLVRATAVNSTSGTAIDFTGIPSWAKRITVMFDGVSTSGDSKVLVKIGSGSIDSTGYRSTSTLSANSTIYTSSSIVGFGMRWVSAALTVDGSMMITNIHNNAFISTHNLCVSASALSIEGAGYKSLSGPLDIIRITAENGTDTFDAGSINIMYEG